MEKKTIHFFGCCNYFNIFASRVTDQGTRCSLSKVKTGIHSRVISSEISGGETELKQVFPANYLSITVPYSSSRISVTRGVR
jgi:hypothetical protein